MLHALLSALSRCVRLFSTVRIVFFSFSPFAVPSYSFVHPPLLPKTFREGRVANSPVSIRSYFSLAKGGAIWGFYCPALPICSTISAEAFTIVFANVLRVSTALTPLASPFGGSWLKGFIPRRRPALYHSGSHLSRAVGLHPPAAYAVSPLTRARPRDGWATGDGD